MRSSSIALVAVAMSLFAGAAYAAGDPTPEQIAAASAKVDQLIAASGAPTEFGNITNSQFLLASHRASGMRCGFETLRGARIEAISAGDGHGPGARCEMTVDGYPVTQEVVRATGAIPVDALADQVLAGERARRPDLRILDNEPVVETVAPIRILTYTYGGPASPQYVQVATSVVGGWRLTIRLEDSYARRGFHAAAAEKVFLLQIVTQLDLLTDKAKAGR